MQNSLLQKLFGEAAGGPCPWLPQLLTASGADRAGAARAEAALKLFSEMGPVVEQEAFARADLRLRDYEGTPFAHEQRTTLEAIYVAVAYSKLALTVAAVLSQATTTGGPAGGSRG